ncbi:hypothetical protein [Streptomyces kronopolitis]|uniref:hypothetical protein n=1 Tax=Streptomyces kronopolitis TaxID=1612435 RepID=UPI003D96857C
MTTATVPQVDAPHAIGRPLDATGTAYALSNADREGAAVPVSGALLRSLLASALHSRGAAALEPDGTVRFTFGQSAGMVPGVLGPMFLAEPCERPPLTPCCARCGHWKGEHDHPGAPTACTRYRLSIGPARFAVPDHDGITYAWVRRMGRSRIVFQITEPSEHFPGGTLVVHRYPEVGDGPVTFCAHFREIGPEERAAFLDRARVHVR